MKAIRKRTDSDADGWRRARADALSRKWSDDQKVESMRLKTVTIEGRLYAEVSDGKPLFVDDDGKQIAVDVPHTTATITRLNGEARGHRERAETAETRLETFKGIDDPKVALKALATVKNLDDKKLVDAGEIERVKAAAIEAVEAKYKPIVEERDKLLGENKAEKLGNAFGKSKFITDKLILPAEAVQKLFGEHFNVENGKIIAKDWHGNVINSRARPGDAADVDEAMETLVEGYSYKDSIIKGIGQHGDSARQSNGGGGGKKTITRAEFDKLDPTAQGKAAYGKDAMTIVD